MRLKRLLRLAATFFILFLTMNVSGLLGQGDDFVGIVRSNNGSVIVIEAWDETNQTPFDINILIGTETKIYGDQDRTQEIAVSDIPKDYVVHGTGEKQPNGDILAAEIIIDGPAEPPPGPQPGDRFKFGGQITEVGSNYVIVSWHNPDTGESGTDRIDFDASTSITDESGNPTTLAVGDFIDGEIEIQSDGSAKAISITKFPSGPQPGDIFKFGGGVLEVGPDYITESNLVN